MERLYLPFTIYDAHFILLVEEDHRLCPVLILNSLQPCTCEFYVREFQDLRTYIEDDSDRLIHLHYRGKQKVCI